MSGSAKMAGESHVGLIRAVNEDSFRCVQSPETANLLAIVADGVGGHGGGDVASDMCCCRLVDEWRLTGAGQLDDPVAMEVFLVRSIERASADIYEQNCLLHRSVPMGSTVVTAALCGQYLVYAHAGDSRLYRWRHGVLSQLTEDHSLRAAVLRRYGDSIDPELLPASNIICKALGPAPSCDPCSMVEQVLEGDVYLLCSDGLSGEVTPEELCNVLGKRQSPAQKVNLLLRMALAQGGHDNITAIVIQI